MVNRLTKTNINLKHLNEIGQWGNWVVQHILEHGDIVDKAFIFDTVQKNMYTLSTDQYSSKVVEKALRFAPTEHLRLMVHSVFASDHQTRPPLLLDMMINQYANYVVQHLLNIAEPAQQSQCVFLMLPHLSILRSSKYGQRVAVLVERLARNMGIMPSYQWVSPLGHSQAKMVS